jgi:hypothetical protein
MGFEKSCCCDDGLRCRPAQPAAHELAIDATPALRLIAGGHAAPIATSGL